MQVQVYENKVWLIGNIEHLEVFKPHGAVISFKGVYGETPVEYTRTIYDQYKDDEQVLTATEPALTLIRQQVDKYVDSIVQE